MAYSRFGLIGTIATACLSTFSHIVTEGTATVTDALTWFANAVDDVIRFVVSITYQPAKRDLDLVRHARVERDRAGDNRRNGPFLAFIERAKAHAQSSSGAYVIGAKGWAI